MRRSNTLGRHLSDLCRKNLNRTYYQTCHLWLRKGSEICWLASEVFRNFSPFWLRSWSKPSWNDCLRNRNLKAKWARLATAVTHGYRRIGVAARLSTSICCRQLDSHDPDGRLTGLVPPCHSRHGHSMPDGPSSRCQLLTGILLPPLDDCTDRRLRLPDCTGV